MNNKFIKLILLGEQGTGKSTFSSLKIKNNDSILKKGIDVVSSNFFHNFKKVNITFYKINDKNINKSLVEYCDAILLFFDLSNESSFNYLYSLLPFLQELKKKRYF